MGRNRFATGIAERNMNKCTQMRAETTLDPRVRGMPRCSGRGGRRFKSCHSDQLSHMANGVRGTIWGTIPARDAVAAHAKYCRRVLGE